MSRYVKDSLVERGIGAAAHYLELRGYEIIDREYSCVVGDIDLVARDECGDIHFVMVDVSNHGFPANPKANDDNRCRLEMRALSWLRDNPDHVDVGIFFDWIAICVVGKEHNRAMLKHCSDFLKYPSEQEMRTTIAERDDADDDIDSGDEAA